MSTIRVVAVGVLAAAVSLSAPQVAGAQPAGVSIDADVRLGDDGVVAVTEMIVVPPGGRLQTSLPLRAGGNTFSVTDTTASGAATIAVVDDHLRIDALPGASTVSYAVHGSIDTGPSGQVFRWSGVLDSDVASISATVDSPTHKLGIVHCFAGPIESAQRCDVASVDPTGVLTLRHTNLHRGDRIDLAMALPPGTIGAAGDGADAKPDAFAPTRLALVALVLVALGLLAGAVYVRLARRRAAAASAVDQAPVGVLLRTRGGVSFASPGGVLPGQAGLVVDERADAVALAATVIDLAVRRYLWIATVDGGVESDWQISRMNPPDESLRPYERDLYLALLPESAESVTISALTAPGRLDSAPIRRAMHADAVANGWFAGPRRRRTASARALLGQIQGFVRHLESARVDEIPGPDQGMVFARSLPFAVALGRVDRWIAIFRDLDLAAGGVYWFGGFEGDRDLHRFAAHFPFFDTALVKLFPPPS